MVGDVEIHLVDLAVACLKRPGERDIPIGVGPDAVSKELGRFDKHRTERIDFVQFRFHGQFAGAARDFHGLIGQFAPSCGASFMAATTCRRSHATG